MHISFEPVLSLSGKSELLLSEIDGEKPMLLNNLDIDSNGIIYLTDSSVKWQSNQTLYSLLEGSGDGRYTLFSSSTHRQVFHYTAFPDSYVSFKQIIEVYKIIS